MAKVQNKFIFTQAAFDYLESLPRHVVDRVFPKVMNKMVRQVKPAYKQALPDSNRTGSRQLQSKKVKARFPYKLNRQVGSKRLRDELGVLQIIGVKRPQGSLINFDFGDKALHGRGRKHVFWGKAKPIRYRKQVRNIPLEMEAKFKEPFRRAFIGELKEAVRKEQL